MKNAKGFSLFLDRSVSGHNRLSSFQAEIQRREHGRSDHGPGSRGSSRLFPIVTGTSTAHTGNMRNNYPPSADILTQTERSVLALIGQGRTSKEIAGTLDISTLTVGNHRRSICRKLNLHSTAELASCGAAYIGTQRMNIPIGTACCVQLHLRTDDGRLTVMYSGTLTRQAKVASVAIGAIVFNF